MLKMKSECALGSDSSLLIGNPSIMLMPEIRSFTLKISCFPGFYAPLSFPFMAVFGSNT